MKKRFASEIFKVHDVHEIHEVHEVIFKVHEEHEKAVAGFDQNSKVATEPCSPFQPHHEL